MTAAVTVASVNVFLILLDFALDSLSKPRARRIDSTTSVESLGGNHTDVSVNGDSRPVIYALCYKSELITRGMICVNSVAIKVPPLPLPINKDGRAYRRLKATVSNPIGLAGEGYVTMPIISSRASLCAEFKENCVTFICRIIILYFETFSRGPI